MEFKEAMRIWKRMCDVNNCDKGCNGCPMYDYCDAGVCRFLDEVEAVLAKWAAEHLKRTRIDDFLDKHPRAYLDDNDTPIACAKNLGYCTECINDVNVDKCDECWREPLEEVEELRWENERNCEKCAP
jgi:hypothetical protein